MIESTEQIQSFKTRSVWPWLAMVAIAAVAALALYSQGRLWICDCGHIRVWTGEVWSNENSQQFLDPYSFTHILHGFMFCGLLALVARPVPPDWRLCLAVSLEAAWEVVENSAYVINRYREATAALGYQGDAIFNSMGDLVMCGLGFVMAYQLGLRRSLVFFLAVEVVLILSIRDSLLLNIIMLIQPIDALKAGQAGH
jgi:hypothetical protein